VRMRAAQGLLAARDKAALPSFVNLLTSAPPPLVPGIEETLRRVAGDQGPLDIVAGSSTDSREKAAKAWAKWFDDNQAKIDLSEINDRQGYLGLITICEYDNQIGNIQGQVWETAKGGAKRWSFGGVNGAMDARTLPNGNVLVAENSGNRVTERNN